MNGVHIPGCTQRLRTCWPCTSNPKFVVWSHLLKQDVHSEFLQRNPSHCNIGKLSNSRVAHALELWGFFLHSFAFKTHKQTWLGGERSDSKGKQGAFQWCRLQMNGLLLFSESLFNDIFRFVVHVLRCSWMLSPGVFQRGTKLPLVCCKRKPSGRFNAED